MVGLGISFKKRGKEEKGKNEKRRIGEKEKRRIEEKKERRRKRRIGEKDEKGEKKKRAQRETLGKADWLCLHVWWGLNTHSPYPSKWCP